MVPTSLSNTESAKCTVCLDVYRDPLILPACGHSVCSACVQQLIANTATPGNVVCPECHVHSPVPTNGFPRSYAIARIIATLEAAGYRESSQCSDCRSEVPDRRLRECKTCATEGSLLLCAHCDLDRHKDHDLAQFRGPPASVPRNPSVQAVAPNPGTNGERTPLPEDCCGRFKAEILAAFSNPFFLLSIPVAFIIVCILYSLMGPLNVLMMLAFGLVISGICAFCL
ncbi:tripartite motif-containing protein 3-like protein [Aphelenchoides avenae]|nr:tripartite motif-containing protein 3-like protein [Aphelenchus avenae]